MLKIYRLSLSVLAALILACSLTAQTKFQPVPESIKALNQPDSPVQIAIDRMLPSMGAIEVFGYTVRNTSEKEVRAINLRTGRDGPTKSFPLGLPRTQVDQLGFESGLKSGASKTFSYPIKGFPGESEEITLSVDFLLFRDGSTWGPDLAEQGDWLIGVFEGQAQFLADVKKLYAVKDEQGLKDMIMRDGPPPSLAAIRAEDRTKRQIGNARGYFATRMTFRSDVHGRGDLTGVPARIRDVEREIAGASAVDDKRKQFTMRYSFQSPLKFIGLSRSGKSFLFDERILADGDWLTGTAIKIKNDSGKTIKSVSLGLFFPETMNTGPGMVSSLRYGPHPITFVENVKQPRIAPSQSFEIVINEDQPGGLMRFLSKGNDFNLISRVVVEINYIDFDDGTRWNEGQLSKQDPDNPRRWIPIKP